jgi:hypothetical protein
MRHKQRQRKSLSLSATPNSYSQFYEAARLAGLVELLSTILRELDKAIAKAPTQLTTTEFYFLSQFTF